MDAKIVDASAIAAVCFGEAEGADVQKRISGSELYAPTVLVYEMANIYRKKSRARPQEHDMYKRGLELFGKMSFNFMTLAAPKLGELALEEGISAFDASYLFMSRKMKMPLVTLDLRLRQLALSR